MVGWSAPRESNTTREVSTATQQKKPHLQTAIPQFYPILLAKFQPM